MKFHILNKIDYVILLCVITLSFFGILFIYSSGINSDGILVSNEYYKQIIWFCIGAVLMLCIAVFDYRKIKKYSKYLYWSILGIFIYTRIFGRYVNGAKSWIGIGSLGIQPSEPGKIIYILYLANFLEQTKNLQPLKRFIKAMLIMILPVGLILLQPDLGTATVYIPVFICMCFIAGMPIRYLALVIGIGMGTIICTVLPIWQLEIVRKAIPLVNILTNTKLRLIVLSSIIIISLISLAGYILFKSRYFYWITFASSIIAVSLILSVAAGKVLKPYQIQRLIVFLDPSSDPRGSGWHIIQSKIAIGSGNFWGKGFMRGTQSHYRFLPEQSTDFIFSISAEEIGFVGCMIFFALFLSIFLRIIYIVKVSSNLFGIFIASGILGMYFFHFAVNVGMVMGMMPITGIPLPFLSYGGSALLTNMMAAGLLMSIHARKLNFDNDVI